MQLSLARGHFFGTQWRYLAERAFGREYVERCVRFRQRKQLGPKKATDN